MLNIFFLAFFTLTLKGEDMIQPPKPKKVEYILEKHGDKRIDFYYWMRERDTKDVVDYIKLENRYTEYVMKDTKKLQQKLYKEIKEKILEDDETVPYKYKNYLYFKRYKKGKNYPLYYRKKVGSNKEELILDVNKVAKGKDYCHLTSVKISPNENILSYAVDFKGRRFYTIYFKDLATNKLLEQKIENVTSNYVWSDNKTIYFTKQDTTTLRWQEILKFDIEKGKMEKIYYEEDPTYSVYLFKSKTENYIFLAIESTLTTEMRYLDLKTNKKEFEIFRKREKGLEYYIDDGEDRFFIRHNNDAKNFKLSYVMKDEDYSDKILWKDIEVSNDDILIEDFEVFKDFVVIVERKKTLINFKIINRKTNEFSFIKFPDEVYITQPLDNHEYENDTFRYAYESMVNPPSVYDYNFKTQTSALLKRKEIPNYDPLNYETKRLWIKARDGVDIPLTVLMKKNHIGDKLYIYGYGSYGYSLDPYFNSSLFPLIDRGFVYAIAHIRGGSELGRKWYEDGRQLKKKNTFYDFIDVTKGLYEMGYGKNGIFAEGGSAGGLLMGAITNLAPELYKGIIAEVPFVDTLTTMLDESIPLTTSEYDEWGNPNIKEYYDYIKSYSPYDNIEKKCYPNILATSGYYDSQVQYWEPLKWIAKLREHNTCNSIILMKMDMSSGHSGKTGRYNYIKEIAFNYAFILKIAQINK